MWVKIENEVWAGNGYTINPIIITKSTSKDNFFEAYAIYYLPEADKIGANVTRDSLKQNSIISAKEFERYKWHHIVETYDANYLTFYIDGKKEGTTSTGFEVKFLATDSVLIGVTANKKNSRFLNATIDDVEFYNTVLTENEVQELYNAPNPNKNKIILNWILACIILIIFIVALYFLIKHRVKIAVNKERQRLELNNKLLETELRVNRASMSPHFLFNSLNALHNFILNNEIDNASDYLIKFSTLLRKILDTNMYESISLNLEIELLERYLEIENLRFDENIKYSFVTEDSLSASSIQIPIMMLQPFVENAIWHGLLSKAENKILTISFSLFEGKYIYCTIEDNGIGRRKDKVSLPEKKSLAIGFVQQRLDLFNKIYNLKCRLVIEDKPNNGGTIVKIILPILNK